MDLRCLFMFLSGFVVGFITALTIIVGVIVLPIILGAFLIIGVYAYFKYRKKQKRGRRY